MPASSSCSAAEPVPIQKPSATERTPGTRSVTTRTPRVQRGDPCSSAHARGLCDVSSRPWRGRPEPRSPSRRAAAAGRARGRCGAGRRPRAAAAAAAAAAAGADAGELLDGLAGDVRVVGCRRRPMRPRSRSTSTTRTLTSSPLLSTSSTLSTRWPGETLEMCSRPSVPLASSMKAPKVGRLDDLADVFVADLDLLHHHPDALDERVAELAVGRVDQHLAVVVDVDLRLELLGQAADRFAALADQQADLRRIDLDRLDARRELAELLARRLDRRRPSCRG